MVLLLALRKVEKIARLHTLSTIWRHTKNEMLSWQGFPELEEFFSAGKFVKF
jgi:hypothetical protein